MSGLHNWPQTRGICVCGLPIFDPEPSDEELQPPRSKAAHQPIPAVPLSSHGPFASNEELGIAPHQSNGDLPASPPFPDQNHRPMDEGPYRESLSTHDNDDFIRNHGSTSLWSYHPEIVNGRLCLADDSGFHHIWVIPGGGLIMVAGPRSPFAPSRSTAHVSDEDDSGSPGPFRQDRAGFFDQEVFGGPPDADRSDFSRIRSQTASPSNPLQFWSRYPRSMAPSGFPTNHAISQEASPRSIDSMASSPSYSAESRSGESSSPDDFRDELHELETRDPDRFWLLDHDIERMGVHWENMNQILDLLHLFRLRESLTRDRE